MKSKNLFVAVMLSVILAVFLGLTGIYVTLNSDEQPEEKKYIVTSFYPMYVMTANLIDGISELQVTNLSEPKTGCLHDYQLTPADLKLLSKADLFVINGCDMESFLDNVMEEYQDLTIVETTNGQTPIQGEEHDHEQEDVDHQEVHDHEQEDVNHQEEHDHEQEDADHEEEHDHAHESNGHMWMSVASYRGQVEYLAERLCEQYPMYATQIADNAKAYDSQLEALAQRQEKLTAKTGGTDVVLLHSAYAYVAKDYGWEVSVLMDLDEEDQVAALSAGDLALAVSEINEKGIRVILAEETYGASVAESLEQETDAKVVYLDTCNRGDFSLDSYLVSMNHNIDRLYEALEIEE